MQYLIGLTLLFSLSSASLLNINFFDADFTQTITDNKGKVLQYEGHIKATKPHFVLWNYKKPIVKDIYISQHEIVIIEPEIEQVIIKKMNQNFNFFNMISHAKKIKGNEYKTSFNDSKFILTIKKNELLSISYKDKFENNVKITFFNQIKNIKIPLNIFTPSIPQEYDLIRD